MVHGTWYVIGMMSGTSLDGLDVVYVKFNQAEKLTFEVLISETLPYSNKWYQTLKNAYYTNAETLLKLHTDYGNFLGKVVKNFIQKHQIIKVDLVASHGQTVFHNPQFGYTLQIGHGAEIAKISQLKVICDFRSQDVAFGGQGAPLVPIGDQLLFSEYDYCLNIGGFSNISFTKNNTRKAFDICPANIVLNHLAEKKGKKYDLNGKIARSGKLHQTLFEELNQLSFYKNKKTMGFEIVEREIFPLLGKYKLDIKDLLNTFTEHIAFKIAETIKPNKKVLLTGGGAFNEYLIEKIRKNSKSQIIIPENTIVNFKEAIIFALLGLLRDNNEINCLKSVTGAFKDHSSGLIYLP